MDAIQTQEASEDPPLQRIAKHTILFLAANPLGTTELALGREARAIQEELERSGHREQFQLVTRWAMRPLDLLRELRKLKPTIVHFSGHGEAGGLSTNAAWRRGAVGATIGANGEQPHGLFFQRADGGPQIVSTAALDETFGAAGSSVKLVVLNGCYSDAQAGAFLAHVGCVVAMGGSIRDDAARSFAIGFYGGLGECESVASAFRQGLASIRLEEQISHERQGIISSATVQHDSTARLLSAPGTDPNSIYIVPRPNPRRRCSIVIRANLKEFDPEVVARVRDQLRLLTGDVSLEITEVQEGSVRLTVSLSPEGALRLEALREIGEMNQICEFDVSSVHVHDTPEVEADGRVDRTTTSLQARSEVALKQQQLVSTDRPSDLRGLRRIKFYLAWQIRKGKLSGANLSEANLSKTNLKSSNLSGVNLGGADVRRANLVEANLVGANLSGANLGGADLSRANLEGANLEGANLLAANLNGANLVGADLSRANLSGANLSGASISEAKLSKVELSRSSLMGANLVRADLSEADLSGADLVDANLSQANLRGADLVDANLSQANLRGADLVDANLSQANLRGADLVDANLSQANLRGANLVANLSAANLFAALHVEPEFRVASPRAVKPNPAEVSVALLIERTLHNSPAYRKIDDSLYVIKQGSAYVMISVVPWGTNRAIVRCTAQLVKGVDVDGPLAKQLLELNSHLRFGAFAVDPTEHTVLFTHTILGGHTLDSEELVATLRDVALIADEYDDKLMKKYGGQRMIDLLEETAMKRTREKHPDRFEFDD